MISKGKLVLIYKEKKHFGHWTFYKVNVVKVNHPPYLTARETCLPSIPYDISGYTGFKVKAVLEKRCEVCESIEHRSKFSKKPFAVERNRRRLGLAVVGTSSSFIGYWKCGIPGKQWQKVENISDIVANSKQRAFIMPDSCSCKFLPNKNDSLWDIRTAKQHAWMDVRAIVLSGDRKPGYADIDISSPDVSKDKARAYIPRDGCNKVPGSKQREKIDSCGNLRCEGDKSVKRHECACGAKKGKSFVFILTTWKLNCVTVNLGKLELST